jgi:hypothetical protein
MFWQVYLVPSQIQDDCSQLTKITTHTLPESKARSPIMPIFSSTETLWRHCRPPLAEFIATALFVWVGCGSAVSAQAIHAFSPNNPQGNSFLVTVSLAFGLAIAVLIYTIAPISGGHINPAVTFAFVLSGKMPVYTGMLYVLAQCLGALLGASIVWGSVGSDVLTDGTLVWIPAYLSCAVATITC